MADISPLYPPCFIPIVIGLVLLGALTFAVRKWGRLKLDDTPQDSSNSTSNTSPSTRPMTKAEADEMGWMNPSWHD